MKGDTPLSLESPLIIKKYLTSKKLDDRILECFNP